jgi:predicted RNA-binding Zn ribbon-like protein
MSKKPSPSRGNAIPSRAATLALVGGQLAFNFANTTSGRGGQRRLEHLRTAGDIAVWAHHAQIIGKASARDLELRCTDSPPLAKRLRQRVLALRDVVYDIGVALAGGKPAHPQALDRLAGVHAECVRAGRLRKIEGTYSWTWNIIDYPAEAILGPIVLSALSLVCQGNLSRIKQCPGNDCGWLFFDSTKNNNRRWCEMEVCGNRAKQRRLRRRRSP